MVVVHILIGHTGNKKTNTHNKKNKKKNTFSHYVVFIVNERFVKKVRKDLQWASHAVFKLFVNHKGFGIWKPDD